MGFSMGAAGVVGKDIILLDLSEFDDLKDMREDMREDMRDSEGLRDFLPLSPSCREPLEEKRERVGLRPPALVASASPRELSALPVLFNLFFADRMLSLELFLDSGLGRSGDQTSAFILALPLYCLESVESR